MPEFTHLVLNYFMDDQDSDVRFRNIAPAMEFMCWVVVALAPMLHLVNGPAVTGDQFVIQVGLFSLALLVGIGLRLNAVWRRTAMTTKVQGGFRAVYSALAVPRFARRTVISPSYHSFLAVGLQCLRS
jgi:hypothetical protein